MGKGGHMLQNKPDYSPDPANPYSVHSGNFDIFFMEPAWETPGPEDHTKFENCPTLRELHLCLRGKGRLELDGTVFCIQRGSVWFTSRETNQFWHEYDKQETLLLRVPFCLQRVRHEADCPYDQLLVSFMHRKNGISGQDAALIGYDQTLCEYSEFLKKRVCSACRCGFESILLGLLLDSLFALNSAERTMSDKEKIEAYVKANVMQKISVADLAKLLSVSERSLFYLFTKHFQTSPTDYINRARMDAAAEHLAKGISVREVSEMFKFSEVTSFCRMFKKYYGVSPSKFCAMQPPKVYGSVTLFGDTGKPVEEPELQDTPAVYGGGVY